MSIVIPPIYRDCRQLLLHTEEVVRRFSRYHRYTVGTDLRQNAMALMRAVHQAVYDRAHQAQLVHALVWRVDDYKLTLQLAIELGAFAPGANGQPSQKTGPGFAAFETAAKLAGNIGKQCGGWQKATAGQAAAHSASARRVQASGVGMAPTTAGSKPMTQSPDHPASLSEPTTPPRVIR